MSSFGDFAAVSGTVDESLATLLRGEVCDGIIAAGYTPQALEILRAKKKGAFVVLLADASFAPTTPVEMREVFGIGFAQHRNDAVISPELMRNVVTGPAPPEHAERDLVLACIVMKYTQSNSVGYALNGQMIGVGAGQQSRVDCVKLAAHKAKVWHFRQHPKVQALPFKPTVKRQDRVNARVRYIEGDLTPTEALRFSDNFPADEQPAALTAEESEAFLKGLKGVCLASDGFFPFRDSIDHASKAGVQFVAQPGGSVADAEVRQACDELGMTMVLTGVRLFHH
jgi:phosphoribosylaminoimidazolecarboxamide formyltransferase/IMP cyclohydrolase